MPIFALALAIALGAITPSPAHQGRSHGSVTQVALPRLAGFSLFSSAEATTLGDRLPGAVCPRPQSAPALTAPANALLWAASLRGWSEGPTVNAWRRFVAWSKGSLRPAGTCATNQASLG